MLYSHSLTTGRIIKMLKNVFLKQNGFTLVELLVTMVISAVLLTAVISFSRTSINLNTNINNDANSTNQLKNAFNYISQDVEQAGLVKTTNPNSFPLTLSWFQNTANKIVTYSLVNGGLQRQQYLNNVLQSTMNVANNVNPNAAKTNCNWDSINHDLAVNITISIGAVNEAQQFIITPRVVQISAQTANTISLSSTANPSSYGNTVTLTATVSPAAYAGTVTFLDNGTTINISPIVNGTATYSFSNLPAGSHPMTAVYSGDAMYAASTSSVLSQTVNQGTPTISVTNSPVTCTGSPQPVIVSGSVAGTISNICYNGSATVPTNANTYAITADFTPTDTADYINLHGASAGNFIINKASTTVAVASSALYSSSGQAVTFTASATPSAASGTVNFKDGSTTIGSSTLTAGQATYTTSTLSVGSHSITTVYSGDTNYTGSTSSILTQTVTNAAASFSPASGPVGTVVAVTGSGWVTSDTISSVSVGGVTATNTLTVNSSGNLSGTITVPTQTVGLKNIIITAAKTGAKTFTGVFKVTTVPTLTSIGKASSTSSSTSISVAVPAGGVAAGNTIIVTFTMSSVTGTVSVTDTKGNTYTSNADVNYSSYERTLVFSAPVTTALVSGNTIIVTYPSAVSKAVSIYYVSGLVLPKDQSATATGNSGSPSSGNTANTTQDYELLIGAIGYNNTSTFTAGGSFTALTKSTAGSSLTIQPEYQIVTSMGAYASSGSITSGRWAAAVVAYKTQ
jgi:prepilin-type N-terminal cleavage/methylation domain-containing protein